MSCHTGRTVFRQRHQGDTRHPSRLAPHLDETRSFQVAQCPRPGVSIDASNRQQFRWQRHLHLAGHPNLVMHKLPDQQRLTWQAPRNKEPRERERPTDECPGLTPLRRLGLPLSIGSSNARQVFRSQPKPLQIIEDGSFSLPHVQYLQIINRYKQIRTGARIWYTPYQIDAGGVANQCRLHQTHSSSSSPVTRRHMTAPRSSM